MKGKLKKKLIWVILHWIIVVNFLFEIFYGMYQVFFKLIPPGGSPGPLMGSSTQISFELMVSRRLYAIETWIAIAGLAIYLAIVYRKQLFFPPKTNTPEPIESVED
jgi:hypothetical protein